MRICLDEPGQDIGNDLHASLYTDAKTQMSLLIVGKTVDMRIQFVVRFEDLVGCLQD